MSNTTLRPVKHSDALGEAIFKNEYTAMMNNKYFTNPSHLTEETRDADEHFEDGYEKSIEWGRELANNATCVAPAIERYVDSVIGPGFTPSPDTGDAELDRLLVQKFNDWGNDKYLFDYCQRMTYYETQLNILTAIIRDGDCFVLPMDTGSIQVIEGHLCKNPENPIESDTSRDFLGVRWNNGIIEGYHFAPSQSKPSVFYPAFDNDGVPLVWPVEFPRRINQSRGVSRLSIVRDNAQMESDSKVCELIRQRINSSVCTYTECQNTLTEGLPGSGASTSSDNTIYDIEPGAHINVPAGRTLKIWSGNTPGDGFFKHMDFNEREICACIGVPKESAFLDPSAASFSALRQSIQEARAGYCRMQRVMIAKFNRPLWEHFIRYIVATDPDIRQKDPLILRKCNWNPPRWPYLEPLSDSQSDTERLKNGSASLSMVCRERHGFNADIVTKEAVQDTSYFVEQCVIRAEELNAKYSDAGITWQTLASITRPDLAINSGSNEGTTQGPQTESTSSKAVRKSTSKKNANI